MGETIGYSAYNILEDAYEYNEDECFIADSTKSLRSFIEALPFSSDQFRVTSVWIDDIIKDYGASNGRYCMGPEALRRFEKAASERELSYHLEDYMERLVNLEVELPHINTSNEILSKDVTTSEVSKMQDTPIGTLVNFPSQKNNFLMFKQICTNPDCTVNDIHFSFVEVDDKIGLVTNGLSFSMCIDTDTWKEISPPKRSATIDHLVKKFMEDLTDGERAELRSEILNAKNNSRSLAEYRLNAQDVLRGILVSYTDIISRGESIIHGGNAASYRLLYKGQEYLIEDTYCPNPKCKCNNVHLQVFKVTRSFVRQTFTTQHFLAKLSFKGKRPAIVELYSATTEEAEELLKVWSTRYPDDLGMLKRRYKEIKEVGKRCLSDKQSRSIEESESKPVVWSRKTGRNEPCPCGSGKKYKKCCGR